MSVVATPRETQERVPRGHKKFGKTKFFQLLRLRKFLRWLDSSFVSSVRCCLFYSEFKHKSSEERRYKAIGCQDRATCPICGTSYWKQKGIEAKSLFLAQRDKLMLEGSDLAQWLLDFEFTVPVILSRLIDTMPLEGKKKYLNKLSRASYDVIADVLFDLEEDLSEFIYFQQNVLNRKVKVQEIEEITRQVRGNIGGVGLIHFWHSRSPLYPHFHWHLILSPFTSEGKLVLGDPFLSKEKLKELREQWREKVSGIFGIDFKQSFNIYYQYVKEEKEALSKFHHRFNYCFRHWAEDLLKYKGKLKKKAVAIAVQRARELQGIKTIRWFGYLSPVRRKKAGFEAVQFRDELLLCPRCGEAVKVEELDNVLIVGLGWVLECPHCGEQFKEEEMKKASAWEKTGRTFVLKHFRQNGAVLCEWDDSKGKIVKGSEILVPYEKMSFYPFKGKKKRFVCHSP